MCGIVGLIKLEKYHSTKNKAMFTDMLYADVVRGMHSTGVFKVTNTGDVDWRKAAVPAYEFFNLKGVPEFLGDIGSSPFLCGHNRAATRGAVKNDNAHPFEVKHITLVHNGTLISQRSLPKQFEVDSHGIANAIAEMGIDKASPKIDGPHSLVWYDSKEKTLNFLRNKDRPMFFGHHKDFILFGSEAGLLRWIAGRYGFELDKIESTDVEKVYSFSEGVAAPVVKTVEAFRFQYQAPNYNTRGWSGGFYGDAYGYSEYEDVGQNCSPVRNAPTIVAPVKPSHITSSKDVKGEILRLRSKDERKRLQGIADLYKAGNNVLFSLYDYATNKASTFVTISGDIPGNKDVIIKGNFSATDEQIAANKNLYSGIVTNVHVLKHENKVMLFLRDMKFSGIPDPAYHEEKKEEVKKAEDVSPNKQIIDSKECSFCGHDFKKHGDKGWLINDRKEGWLCLCYQCKKVLQDNTITSSGVLH